MKQAENSSKKLTLKMLFRNDIVIDYKICLYYVCFIFFYSAYLLINRSTDFPILILIEAFILCEFLTYVQFYFMDNFDEAEQLGLKEALYIMITITIWCVIAYIMNWFHKELITFVIFAVYLLVIYVGTFLINLIRRRVETNNLNKLLDNFKEGEKIYEQK